MIKALSKFVTNPYTNLIIGVLFLYSGGSEAWHEISEMKNFRIGVHHGVILFASLQILKTLPDIFEGVQHIQEANPKKS